MNNIKLIFTKKDLKDVLDYESRFYNQKRLACFFGLNEKAVIWKFQTLLRKTEYAVNSNKKLLTVLYKLRYNKMQNKYAMHIPVNTCGKGLHIMHIGPILINGNAKLGENCSLHINTSIVAGGTSDGVPVIGNNVVLGVGCVVLGDVFIADNIAVGANAVVNKSFEENDIAIAGVPAKKISNNGTSQWNKKTKRIN